MTVNADSRTVDEEIRTQAQKGSAREALSLCVQEHAEVMGRLAMALLGSQVDAEKVVEEAFKDVLPELRKPAASSSVRALLCSSDTSRVSTTAKWDGSRA
jgi:DNA-directed RNA polymerase specialized sigma24 family protein